MLSYFKYQKPVISKIGLLFLLLLLFQILNGQKIEKVIDKQIYQSYYSNSLKVPLYVVYNMYNGGGDFSRKHLKFIEEEGTAKNKDYAKSGFDRGHLVSAEDFAFDGELEKRTFSYYNIFPQHPKLNRGSWKSWETTIRNESKKWPLKIYVGAIYGDKKIKNKIAIPEYCWKVVINKKNGLILHSLLFKNDQTETVSRISIQELKNKLNYPIEFKN
jgi:endonuclease G